MRQPARSIHAPSTRSRRICDKSPRTARRSSSRIGSPPWSRLMKSWCWTTAILSSGARTRACSRAAALMRRCGIANSAPPIASPTWRSSGAPRQKKRAATSAALLHNEQTLLRCGGGWGRSFQLCRLLRALGLDGLVAFGGDAPDPRDGAAGAGRNKPSDDDVLLQALERIDLAVDGGFGEHARGLLEGRRREHRTRLQARLGDAQQNRASLGRLAGCFGGLGIGLFELDQVDLFAGQQRRRAALLDLHLLQHLAHDHFDMLVVDL